MRNLNRVRRRECGLERGELGDTLKEGEGVPYLAVPLWDEDIAEPFAGIGVVATPRS